MQATPGYGWPYPQQGDHTRMWEYWEAQVKAIENTIRNGYRIFGSIEFGDNTWANNSTVAFNKLEGADVYRAHVGMSTGGLAQMGLLKNGVEVNRLRLGTDGSLRIENSGQPARYLPFAFAQNSALVTVTSSNVGTATVTFPAGRFTQQPIVLAGCGADHAYVGSTYGAITTTGFTAAIRHIDGTAASVSKGVNWIAIQGTPSAGPV